MGSFPRETRIKTNVVLWFPSAWSISARTTHGLRTLATRSKPCSLQLLNLNQPRTCFGCSLAGPGSVETRRLFTCFWLLQAIPRIFISRFRLRTTMIAELQLNWSVIQLGFVAGRRFRQTFNVIPSQRASDQMHSELTTTTSALHNTVERHIDAVEERGGSDRGVLPNG